MKSVSSPPSPALKWSKNFPQIIFCRYLYPLVRVRLYLSFLLMGTGYPNTMSLLLITHIAGYELLCCLRQWHILEIAQLPLPVRRQRDL